MSVTGFPPNLLKGSSEFQLLNGFSSAQVLLVSRNGEIPFVRKIARTTEQSQRLQAQVEKQKKLSSLLTGVAQVPQIIGEDVVDGLYLCDMEYIKGLDGPSFLAQATTSDVRWFAEQVSRYFEHISTLSMNQPETTHSLFAACYLKVCDVERKMGGLPPELLAAVFLGLEKIRSLGVHQRTVCHGDFTLENMIVTHDRSLVLVDSLDSYYEHYWQDVVKIHQDLEGGWYQVRHKPIALSVLHYLGNTLMETVGALNKDYAEIHPVLLLVTFIRILPYVRCQADRDFLDLRLSHVLEWVRRGGMSS